MSSHLPYTLLIWGAVAVIGLLTAIAWREQGKRGATPFALAMFCGTWWATASALGLFAETGAWRVVLGKIEWAGIVYIPVAWLFFALAFTGRERHVTPRNAVLLSVLPTATLSLVMTNALHHLVYTDIDQTAGAITVLAVEFGPWFWVHQAYASVLVAVGTGLIVGVALDRGRLYVGQVAAVVLVVLPPVVAQVLYVGRVPPFQVLDPTPYAFAVSGLAGLVAVRQYQFLAAAPVTGRVAQRSVLDAMDAGVIVVDGSDRVVEINPAATRLCSVTDAVVGEAATAVFEAYERITDGAEGDPVTVEVGVDGQERILEVSRTPLGNGEGAVLVLHDVTEQRTRLQRLDVLNRVLRHNLRNEMNVVFGYADRVADETESSALERVAERIKEKAMSMTAVGDSAREIDRILQREDEPPDPVPADTVLDWERERLAADHPDVSATVGEQANAPGASCPADAATVLAILVDAVLAHNDAAEPAVDVDVTAGRGTVTFTVTDNGSGIPEMDRAVLEAGEETDLQHGSGLGLWLANWGASALGGDMEVTDEGQAARLTVPRADDHQTAGGS